MHSTSSLSLDSRISLAAQKHAVYLASIQQFQHSRVAGYGENLYRVCGGYNLQSNFIRAS